ncbi:MAG: TIGR00282 family metallophosphoesterase [bacterium]|nr:TIGR00282 family metallophosphoesterase [bacterium]
MRIIFIGDIFGKIGRNAVSEILPKWRKKYKPDFVIGQNENLAHGIGITKRTLGEMLTAGFDIMTGGNHTFKGDGSELLKNPESRILRPANYPPNLPGSGERIIVDKETGTLRLLVINLIGRVFFHENFDDPFRTLDEILARYKNEKLSGIFVDFHSEATSEANALGHYADGRVSALVGTHTHIGTVDTHVLSGGTAYVTDVGSVSAVDSVIGETKENIIYSMLSQRPFQHEPVETGLCNIGAVLIDIDEKTNKAKSIKRIDEQIVIE